MNIENAVQDALHSGKALCKFISRNDVGATNAHQCGFYLPKAVWRMFASFGPVKGRNDKSFVKITWPGNVITNSSITWYGIGTRSEYRLTRFGRKFPWLNESYVGSLLVLVPFSLEQFSAYILETEEEIGLLQAALGIEIRGEWGVYSGGPKILESEDECLSRVFNLTVKRLDEFPTGSWMAQSARAAVEECSSISAKQSPDTRLMKWIDAEYQLYRTLENKLAMPSIKRSFKTVDEFIGVAATVMNRRKSRAGHSLEHHVEALLKEAGLPFDRQPRIDGKVQPDLLIPGKSAYENPKFPTSGLVVVGLKTTCKDRWRQVLNEGKRIPQKHLLTLQEAISSDQLKEMRDASITLVVPKKFHSGYDLKTGINLLSVEHFIHQLKDITRTHAA